MTKRTSWLGLCSAMLLCACGGSEVPGGEDAGGSGPGASNPGAPDAGSPDGGAPPAPGPNAVTVRGRVLDLKGKPVDGAAVLIQGQQPVTTDAAGGFSFSGVTPPYDLVVVNRAGLTTLVYQGVTRQDPTLMISNPPDSPVVYSSDVTGTLSGASQPSGTVAPPEMMFVSPESTNTPFWASYYSGTYTNQVSWSDSPTTTGTLFVLQGERTYSVPGYTKFTGFGRRDNVSLRADGIALAQDIPLTPVPNSRVGARVTVPPGFNLSTHSVGLQLAPDATFGLVNSQASANSFNYVVPVVAQNTFAVSASASSPGSTASSLATKSNVAAGILTLDLTLPVPPTLKLPVNKANNVTRTSEFSWSGTAGGVYFVTFSWNAYSSGSLTIVTDQTRTTIPDLSALDLAVPTNAQISWVVQQHHPVSSVDFFLRGEGSWSGVPKGLNEYYVGTAAARTFVKPGAP